MRLRNPSAKCRPHGKCLARSTSSPTIHVAPILLNDLARRLGPRTIPSTPPPKGQTRANNSSGSGQGAPPRAKPGCSGPALNLQGWTWLDTFLGGSNTLNDGPSNTKKGSSPFFQERPIKHFPFVRSLGMRLGACAEGSKKTRNCDPFKVEQGRTWSPPDV